MPKRSRTPQQRHADHPVAIRPGRGPHHAEIWCQQCGCHVQWLSARDCALLEAEKSPDWLNTAQETDHATVSVSSTP